jgi:hypothetical protein
MKLSSNTVEVYARKLGLSRPKPEPWNALSEKDERLILNMYEYGDFDELSKLVGRNKHTISEWARKRGLRREVIHLILYSSISKQVNLPENVYV